MQKYSQISFSLTKLFQSFILVFVLSFSIFANAKITPEQEALLIQSGQASMLNLLGQRLIDPPHWQQGVEEGVWPIGDDWEFPQQTIKDPARPKYLGYGEPTFENWKKASLYVILHRNRFPSLKDYLKVHALSFYNAPDDMFWGYYSMQIWRKFQPPKRDQIYKLLNEAQYSSAALQQLFNEGIENGRGKLRDQGDTSWSGKQWSKKDNRALLYSQAEFDRLARQPYLRVEVKSVTPEGIDARFLHTAGPNVTSELNKLFVTTYSDSQKILKLKISDPQAYRKQAILLASEFYINLLLIHGLWDGVGRASKQMRDWLLRYFELPVPDSTPVDDMEYTPEEYAVILEQAIRRTEMNLGRVEIEMQRSGYNSVSAYTCEALYAH